MSEGWWVRTKAPQKQSTTSGFLTSSLKACVFRAADEFLHFCRPVEDDLGNVLGSILGDGR